MNREGDLTIHRFEKGRLCSAKRSVVQEYPLRLTVNDRELATLIASPHQLNFLVAGFLRNQGFVESLDDMLTLGVCSDFGDAKVRLAREIPERLKPTLTSGCGTGITFSLPDGKGRGEAVPRTRVAQPRFAPEAVFALMKDLQQQADSYKSHGGIHSAAVGNGRDLLLYAEDLGRHNTLDRIAGEALFKGVDLAGKMLVTSGRISTEMVGKAARLGIALIASRTSPTDMAVRMAEQAGITLVGYVRGERFEVYCHPETLEAPMAEAKIAGVTGVILAGGESRRMGCDKSLLPVAGARFIEHIYRRLEALFEEVIIVTNSPGLYAEIPCRKVPDIYYAQGSLAGIHSGVCHANSERAFVVACDMPFLCEGVIREICARGQEASVVIPRTLSGLEPLHALYAKGCLPAMEQVLERGERKIIRFFPEVAVCELPEQVWGLHDPEGRSFLNINTPREYFSLREGGQKQAAGFFVATEEVVAGGRR